MTHRMPFFRIAALSSMCCEENLPPRFSSILTQSKATAVAIINTLMSKVCTIFRNFVATKVA